MKTPQNVPFCIKSAKKILGGKPHQIPPLFQVWLLALQKRLATPLAWTRSHARESLISRTHLFLPHDIPPTKKILEGGGQTPPDPPPSRFGCLHCTKKASYAPDICSLQDQLQLQKDLKSLEN